ncbi:MAG: hypothetical protein ACPLW5_00625, partial [Candidatus Bathyarchaeales archaeon]
MQKANILTIGKRINLLGIISASLLLYLSLSNEPWWTLKGGSETESTLLAEISLFMFNIKILGKPLTIPIIPYLNLAAKLMMLLSALTTLIGSLLPTKPWTKPLISLKGLALPIIFIAGTIIALKIASPYIGIDLPLAGNFVISYTINEFHAEIPTATCITAEYWIACIAGITSVLAKFLQGKIPTSTETYSKPQNDSQRLLFKALNLPLFSASSFWKTSHSSMSAPQ